MKKRRGATPRRGEPTVVVDGDLRVLHIDAAGSRWLGYDATELQGVHLDRIVTSSVGSRYGDVLRRFFLEPGAERREDSFLCVRRRDGSELLAEVTARKVSRDGEIVVHLSIRHAPEDPIALVRHCAAVDAVTGIPNRRALVEELGRRIAASEGAPSGLFLIALAGFKDQLMSLGFAVADELLRESAFRIQSACGPDALVAHMDGHRFAVLPGTEVRTTAELQSLAHAISERLEEAVAPADSEPVFVEPRIGIVLSPAHGSDPERLVMAAEIASSAAREMGEPVAVYDPERDGTATDRLQILGQLRRALVSDALELHYQPIVDLGSGDVARVEALLRWPGRNVGPDVFIPLAEKSGLIRHIDQWVLRRAIHQAAAWGSEGAPYPVSVNLSAQTFQDPTLPERVARLLRRNRLSADRLHLEITETALMTSPESAERVSAELRAQGIQISLDDFGAGYSPLIYLQRMGVSALKIDQSFVGELGGLDGTGAIVQAIVDLGRRLGLQLVAEGIEDAGTAEALLGMGCQFGQGFHFSPPVPPHTLFEPAQLAA